MNVSETEFQKSMKLLVKYTRLVSKHEGIVDTYQKSLNSKIDYSVSVDPKFDTMSVSDLEIGSHTFGVILYLTNIRTIGDLIRTNPREVRKLKGMGNYRFNTILESLDTYGVRWFEIHGVENV